MHNRKLTYYLLGFTLRLSNWTWIDMTSYSGTDNALALHARFLMKLQTQFADPAVFQNVRVVMFSDPTKIKSTLSGVKWDI